MHHVITLAEDAAAGGLPYPPYVPALIAVAVFVLLGVVTWSYRDVANRHDHKTGGDAHH